MRRKMLCLFPTQAIIPEEQNKSVIVAKNGKAHFTPCENREYEKLPILRLLNGIQPGDTVIITGILFLKEGSKLILFNS